MSGGTLTRVNTMIGMMPVLCFLSRSSCFGKVAGFEPGLFHLPPLGGTGLGAAGARVKTLIHFPQVYSVSGMKQQKGVVCPRVRLLVRPAAPGPHS